MIVKYNFFIIKIANDMFEICNSHSGGAGGRPNVMDNKRRIATAKGRSPEKINDLVVKGRSSTPKNNKSKL